jgi:hypothetical protein
MDSAPQGGRAGDLEACPKNGCPATGPQPIFQSLLAGFLASNEKLAFASIGYGAQAGVYRLNDDGTSTTLTALGYSGFNWLTVRDGTLYATLYGANFERTIVPMNLATNELGTTSCNFPTAGLNTDWSVVTTERIFLAAHSVGGSIYYCPRDGGDFAPFLTGQGSETYVLSMATDDTNIYWVDANGSLWSCPASGTSCNPTALLTTANAPAGAKIITVLHSSGDLIVETSAGDVVGCKASGCPGTAKPLVHEAALANGWGVAGSNVAADANAIYYVARDGVPDAGATYRLMRLPRKPL